MWLLKDCVAYIKLNINCYPPSLSVYGNVVFEHYNMESFLRIFSSLKIIDGVEFDLFIDIILSPDIQKNFKECKLNI